MLPETGWIHGRRDPCSADTIAPTLDESGLRRTWHRQGASAAGGHGCRARRLLRSTAAASRHGRSASTSRSRHRRPRTQFTAEVTERSVHRRPVRWAQRLMPPLIQYGETEAIVVFAAQPLAGDPRLPRQSARSRSSSSRRAPGGERVLMDGAVLSAAGRRGAAPVGHRRPNPIAVPSSTGGDSADRGLSASRGPCRGRRPHALEGSLKVVVGLGNPGSQYARDAPQHRLDGARPARGPGRLVRPWPAARRRQRGDGSLRRPRPDARQAAHLHERLGPAPSARCSPASMRR